MSASVAASTLLRLTSEALISIFGCAELFEAHARPGAFLVLTGEPFADLNYLVAYDAPDTREVFCEFAQLCIDRPIPFVCLLGPAVSARLAAPAAELGLDHVSGFPLMVCMPASLKRPAIAGVVVQRVQSAREAMDSAAVMASAFRVSEQSTYRACPFAINENPAVDVFVARSSGQAASTVTTTLHGDTVGIWAMGTDPRHQRQGIGRVLLLSVMHEHLARGARRFFLWATPSGKSLYHSIGFESVAFGELLVSGTTSQASR